jgi:hypothetical protein
MAVSRLTAATPVRPSLRVDYSNSTAVRTPDESTAQVLDGMDFAIPVRSFGPYALSSRFQISVSAVTSRSICSSECSGVGVSRRRSVPRRTVG